MADAPLRFAKQDLDDARLGLFIDTDVAGATVPVLLDMEGRLEWMLKTVLLPVDGIPSVVHPLGEVPGDGDRVLRLHGTRALVGSPERSVVWDGDHLEGWLHAPAIDAVDLLGRVRATIASRVWFPEQIARGATTAIALWVLYGYLPIFSTAPYLHIHGIRNCGKTELLDCLESLVYRPMLSSNVSPAVVYRHLDVDGGTALIDEAESIGKNPEKGQDLLNILNGGYRKGLPVRRTDPNTMVSQKFNCYGPKAIAGIEDLPETLRSRCITVEMTRRPDGAPMPSPPECRVHRGELLGFALAHGPHVLRSLATAQVPVEVGSNRDADVWGPLWYIARYVQDRGGQGVLDELMAFREYTKRAGQRDVDSFRAACAFEALRQLLQAGCTGIQAQRILAVLRRADPDEWVRCSPKRIGGIMRAHGVEPSMRTGLLVYDQVTAGEIDLALQRYGLAATETPVRAEHVEPGNPIASLVDRVRPRPRAS